MIGLLGVLAEAWSEVRVHKARVVLSLVGVFLAVFAMVSLTGLGLIVAQVQQEQGERYGGRSATVALQAYDPMTGLGPPAAQWDAAVDELLDRYGVSDFATTSYRDALFRLPGGTQQLGIQVVSPSYGPLHRVQPIAGRWFTDGDRTALAPALVVNEYMLGLLGGGEFTAPRAVVLGGPQPVTATVVGVFRDGSDYPTIYRIDRSGLDPPPSATADPAAAMYGASSLELWVPTSQVDEVIAAVQSDLPRMIPGLEVSAYRADQVGLEGNLATLRLAVRGAGGVALLLGGLGVFNVGLMAVRQRIREIGIRRSFGATSARIFAAIMLESVVATVLAGLAAVALAIAVVDNFPFMDRLTGGIPIADMPGFPLEAALEGLAAAAAVGALAGLLPALIAVRVKVIDAIRF